MFLYLGVSGHPHVCMPHTLYTPCMFIHPQGCTPPYAPILFCASVFLEALHVVGGCNGIPFVLGHLPYTIPVWGASPSITPPTLSYWFPVHWYVSGISICYMGISLLLKGLGVFPHQLGGLGASALEMSICSFLYIFL